PALLGGNLIFTTYEPDDDICSAGGTNNLYTLYYQTGTAWQVATELVKRESTYGDGEEAKSEEYGSKDKMEVKKSLQKGLPTSPVIHVGETVTVMSSDSNSLVGTLNMRTPFKVKSGMESWREE
ncbi:MAG: hypothetical protein JRE20_06225, partial [Deltaproteobacteria bacterium]|nr:hypothetical protein [Deltaproteobacteria bacterium]